MLGVVLAAGQGTRMAPLTPERHKALLPTFGVPQLAWVLASLARAGIEQAWVNAHQAPEQLAQVADAEAARRGMAVELSHERELALGTAGALRHLAAQLTEPFVVANADVACDAPLERLLAAHRSARAPATLLAIPVAEEADFYLDESWVGDLIDRREEIRAGHRYAGVGVFEPEVLRYIPDGPSGLYETVLTGLVNDGRGVAALEWEGYWLDIATPTDHLNANLDILSSRREPRLVSDVVGDSCSRWDVQAYVGAGASVADVDLRHAVVGDGAVVAPGSQLERCVVWDGATVPRGRYREAIVTRTQVVRLK